MLDKKPLIDLLMSGIALVTDCIYAMTLLRTSYRKWLYIMVGILSVSILVLIVGFYGSNNSFFIIGNCVVVISTGFAKNTILGFVKSFSVGSIKAIGISISFTNMIGNLYCILLKRVF